MIFNLSNPYDKSKAAEYFRTLMDKEGTIELKACMPRRSKEQNAYLHLLLGYFASQYGCTLEEAKVDFYKRTCNRELFETKVMNKKGKEVTVLRSSATLDSRDMTTSIERFRNWSASVAEIYLPSPNEEQFLAHCRQEMERNKEFV